MPQKKTSKRASKIQALYRQESQSSPPMAPAAERYAGLESMAEMEDPNHTSMSSSPAETAMEADSSSFGKLGKSAKAKGASPEFEIQEGGGGATESVSEEEEPFLLDAWYADFSDPATRAVMREKLREESILEVVIGDDDRRQIRVTQNYPWRCICSLLIRGNDGSGWIGTGWLVGPRTVITAGHCVYIHSNGGWARQIEVIPGRDAANRPFGSAFSSTLRSVRGWVQNRDTNYDYGAIILPPNAAFGNQLGWFGYQNLGDAELNGLTVNIAGYPGDKPVGTHWWHALPIKGVEPQKLVYDIDTAGGQSGAPVWVFRNNQRRSVGIHTNGSVAGNRATRISSGVAARIRDWKGEGG